MTRFSKLRKLSGEELLTLTRDLINDMALRHSLEIGSSERKSIPLSFSIKNTYFIFFLFPASNELNEKLMQNEENGENKESEPGPSNFVCGKCNRKLSCLNNLTRHQELYCRYRNGKKAKCPVARQRDVVEIDDGDAQFGSDDNVASRTQISLNGRVRDYELHPTRPEFDVPRWLTEVEEIVKRVFRQFDDYLVRGRMVLRAKFVKRDPSTLEVLSSEIMYLSSLPADFIHDFQQWYERHTLAIIKNLDNFQQKESSLEFECIELLDLKFNLLNNLSGRAYFQLPDKLKRMQAVINVETNKNCFQYALLSILHYQDLKTNRQRSAKYEQWLEELEFGEVDPSDVHIRSDVPKIEKLNNIKINIHVWEKGELQGCVYNNPRVLSDKTVNLLLIVNSQGERHYCGIPSLSRLYTHLHPTRHVHHACERCIRFFKSKQLLDDHYQWCARGRLQIEKTPKHTNFTYNSFHKELSPFKVIYADIESYIQEGIHYPAAIASYEVFHSHLTAQRQNTRTIKSWSGEDCIVSFLSYLDDMAQLQHHRDRKMTRQAMILTTQQEKDFQACSECPKCKSTFDETTHKKVRDHDHITGKFRSALCHICNSKLYLARRSLPVVFHNFKGYDAHQLIKHGIGKFKHWQLSVIPQTKEKYMSLTARIPVDKAKEGKNVFFNVVFLDSFQFMSSSLANLTNNLDSLPFTEVLQRDYPNLQNDTLRRKGVFPYSYFDSLSCLQETSLPSREAFTNDLNGKACSEEDYRFAQKAWQEFGCQTFGDYLMAYLKLDVILLACVFERFRSKTLEQDGLDPVHFVSLPGLSFLSAFKMTGESINLINDLEMYTFFERGIRGGMTFVNKHMVQNERIIHNGTEYMQHLAYIDENNLYGNALRKPLPHSDFCWVEDLSDFTRDFILGLDEETEVGYTLEVDLGYPEHLHHKTADFPLAPESGDVSFDMLSDFMKTFYQTLEPNKAYRPVRKLLLTQYNKEHYFVHFVVLKFYLSMGMTLNKVHRVVKYKQKPWLKEYIDFNSRQRSLTCNNFDKDFYKLKNNSLFGKTMEDVRKRINYKLVTDEDKFIKLANSPFFHDRDIISDDITGVHMLKSKVTLDKPVFVGQAVLDYSKLEMYNLFYHILPQCPLIKKLQLVGGDTDSFFLAIVTDLHITLSDVFNNLAQYIDTSNYPPSHSMYSVANKAKLGCFKDETAGQMLEEMILLRPKMYSMKYRDSDKSIKRAKGITKHIVQNTLRHNTYKEAFEEKKTTRVQMTILKSTQHTIQTTTFTKRALSAFEDKRCWLSENESLPHGHVDSPVPLPKRRRLLLPAGGDVCAD